MANTAASSSPVIDASSSPSSQGSTTDLSSVGSAPSSTASSSICPATWGHRGSSGAFPENTMKAFEAAVAQGAMFIETDVHMTKDKIVVMSHDPSLDRVTNGKGMIKDHDYIGDIDQLWTKKQPHQRMPTLKETIEFLVRPENAHVGLNLDIKMTNPPDELFRGIHEILKAYPDHEKVFSRDRVVLGIWHPKYIEPAQRILPYLGLAHIGVSVRLARQYFWDACDAFSMEFHSMVGAGGAAFRADCAASGKKIMVWTVNERASMIEAAKWGNCSAVLTDHPERFTKLRAELMGEGGQKIRDEVTWRFGWSRVRFFTLYRYYFDRFARAYMVKIGGPLEISPAVVGSGEVNART